MNPLNKAEYEKVNAQIGSISDWITRYTGYFIIGSGAVFLSITRIDFNKASTEGVAYFYGGIAFYLICLVTMAMLYLIFYKFESHNRMSGYAKCITQEYISRNLNDVIRQYGTYDKQEKFEKNIYLFDESIYMARLINSRVIKNKKEQISTNDYENIDGINNSTKKINISFGDNEFNDKYLTDILISIEGNYKEQSGLGKYTYSIRTMFCALMGYRIDTKSWAYPIYVTQIYLILIILEFLLEHICL